LNSTTGTQGGSNFYTLKVKLGFFLPEQQREIKIPRFSISPKKKELNVKNMPIAIRNLETIFMCNIVFWTAQQAHKVAQTSTRKE
jgi:hypothetical protein